MPIDNSPRRLLVAALALLAIGCGDAAATSPASRETVENPADADSPTGRLRLGYFPNITHAPAIIGVDEGILQEALGPGVELELFTFNSGTEVIEALYSGGLDASFIGPNPAINGFARSDGRALRIVAGSTSGGAALVVRPGITSPADLGGTVLATPALGNTQDVALRAWLSEQGYRTDTAAGGDVSIRPQDNADTLTSFIDGSIDGAWVPEPWATRLVLEGGGTVLLDEREIWPDGEFVTTHLIVATEYLADNEPIVEGLVAGLLDSLDRIAADPESARDATNAGIEGITTKALASETIEGAWPNLTFTYDPIASSLEGSKDDAVEVGLLDPVDLAGIYDLTILNRLLAERGLPEVPTP